MTDAHGAPFSTEPDDRYIDQEHSKEHAHHSANVCGSADRKDDAAAKKEKNERFRVDEDLIPPEFSKGHTGVRVRSKASGALRQDTDDARENAARKQYEGESMSSNFHVSARDQSVKKIMIHARISVMTTLPIS